MIERYFLIEDFRSIGLDGNASLSLNFSLSKEIKFGGIVTLIGENNVGKSNVLDAIKAYSKREFEKDDLPYNKFDSSISPKLSLYVEDHIQKIKVKMKLKDNRFYFDIYEKDKLLEFKEAYPELNEETKQILLEILNNKNIYADYNLRRVATKEVIEPLLLTLSDNRPIPENSYIQLKTFFDALRNHALLRYFANHTNYQVFIKDIQKLILKQTSNEWNAQKDYVEEKLGFKAIPNIIEYNDKNVIKNSDIISAVQNGEIANPSFFEKLFDLLEDQKIDELKHAYKSFFESGQNNKAILNNYANKVNESLKKLVDQFNKVYNIERSKEYNFKLDLESNKIYFMLSENNEDIILDSQSTGFKWFFNFFFNIFADSSLEPGDIIILDEPATNLHVSGQRELRKQIKSFGQRAGITFVISTHSPFFIDPDHLDELRIVYKEKSETKIMNQFTDNQTIDVMMPINAALTVGRHILFNPSETMIFVEGITDYNYLIMAKHVLGKEYEKIHFMPINGIKRKELLKNLLAIRKNPILLVDADSIGQRVYDKYKDQLVIETIKLSDIDSSFIQIEDIFTDQEKNTWKISHDNDRRYKVSSALKNALIEKTIELDDKTLINLKRILDRLSE